MELDPLAGGIEITPEESFIIGEGNLQNLEIRPGDALGKFHYFFDKNKNRLIKSFVIGEGPQVRYVCHVTLIKKDEKFTPRICFSVRDKRTKEIIQTEINNIPATRNIKANVDLGSHHENFWQLISFIKTFRDIEVPDSSFSLVSKDVSEIIDALKERDPASLKSIIEQLGSTPGVKFSQADLNKLLGRKETLAKFESALEEHKDDESWWQNFFEENKWIFGYGLNYQILNPEQTQPHYGGTRVDGKGAQKGDYLTATEGDVSFTVLVEIKTPGTTLLAGTEEIRSGVWSLSKKLTDALAQIQGNTHTWDHEGSRQDDNKDTLEGENIFTIVPKGILVIGSLSELDTRPKKKTFQRFRQSINGFEILTYDELYRRAQFIVEPSE